MSHQAMSAQGVLIEEMLERAIYHWRRGSARRGSRQRLLARRYINMAVAIHRGEEANHADRGAARPGEVRVSRVSM
jgi:hypothetical protein